MVVYFTQDNSRNDTQAQDSGLGIPGIISPHEGHSQLRLHLSPHPMSFVIISVKSLIHATITIRGDLYKDATEEPDKVVKSALGYHHSRWRYVFHFLLRFSSAHCRCSFAKLTERPRMHPNWRPQSSSVRYISFQFGMGQDVYYLFKARRSSCQNVGVLKWRFISETVVHLVSDES
jgi:hypothetical protein